MQSTFEFLWRKSQRFVNWWTCFYLDGNVTVGGWRRLILTMKERMVSYNTVCAVFRCQSNKSLINTDSLSSHRRPISTPRLTYHYHHADSSISSLHQRRLIPASRDHFIPATSRCLKSRRGDLLLVEQNGKRWIFYSDMPSCKIAKEQFILKRSLVSCYSMSRSLVSARGVSIDLLQMVRPHVSSWSAPLKILEYQPFFFSLKMIPP